MSYIHLMQKSQDRVKPISVLREEVYALLVGSGYRVNQDQVFDINTQLRFVSTTWCVVSIEIYWLLSYDTESYGELYDSLIP